MKTFGPRLRLLRNEKQLTGEELGRIFNVTKVAISNWESGNRTPDAEMFIKVADFFDVSLDYLFGRTDNPQGVILNNDNLPIPEEFKDNKIEIEADRKTMPKQITEDMVRNILQTLEDQGYDVKNKKE